MSPSPPRRAALEKLESRLRAERQRDLDVQRAMLEERAANELEARLSEQRHRLLAEAGREKAEEIQALQRELHHRDAANTDQLRTQVGLLCFVCSHLCRLQQHSSSPRSSFTYMEGCLGNVFLVFG